MANTNKNDKTKDELIAEAKDKSKPVKTRVASAVLASLDDSSGAAVTLPFEDILATELLASSAADTDQSAVDVIPGGKPSPRATSIARGNEIDYMGVRDGVLWKVTLKIR